MQIVRDMTILEFTQKFGIRQPDGTIKLPDGRYTMTARDGATIVKEYVPQDRGVIAGPLLNEHGVSG